jgi:uncharacterized membrane protein YoaK (UPF0700 family)
VTRYSRRAQALAIGLAALAGYVDAIGFLKLGGFFVSFMSGNSTRLGVGLAERSSHAVIAAALLTTFVCGVVVGSSVGALSKGRRRPAVLGLVMALLTCAASLGTLGQSVAAIGFMTLAMGAENAVFVEGGEVRIGLTYMTGALVKMGQAICAALMGGDRYGWAPYLRLWLGLVCGGVIGALAYGRLGIGGLWPAAAAAGLLALASTAVKD